MYAKYNARDPRGLLSMVVTTIMTVNGVSRRLLILPPYSVCIIIYHRI